MNHKRLAFLILGLLLVLVGLPFSLADNPPTLARVQTISLKGPEGRLDHLALDTKYGRLFVANMANASLDIVDIKTGKLVQQIPDQKGIQGVAYASDLNRIFAGNGEGNACNVFDGKDYKLLKSIPLGDADNVRYQFSTHRIFVGHDTALAVIDAKRLTLLTDIKLPGQPESFQLEKKRPRLYVNVPSQKQVVVVDTDKNEIVGRYPLTLAEGNYPLTLDEAGRRIFAGCRKTPTVLVLDSDSGKELASVPIPADIDDLFYDAKQKRLYASCGEGFLAVIRQIDADHYETLQKIATVKLARTSLFDSETGRLYQVVPRHGQKDGPEIWVYQTR